MDDAMRRTPISEDVVNALARGSWNVAVAFIATLGGGVVMGVFVFSGQSNQDLSLLERAGGGVFFAVYSVTIPFILVVAALAGLYYSTVVKRRPTATELLAVVGGFSAAQFIAFQAWWWFGDHLSDDFLAPGPLRLWLGFLLGGLVVGALAGKLIRVRGRSSGTAI